MDALLVEFDDDVPAARSTATVLGTVVSEAAADAPAKDPDVLNALLVECEDETTATKVLAAMTNTDVVEAAAGVPAKRVASEQPARVTVDVAGDDPTVVDVAVAELGNESHPILSGETGGAHVEEATTRSTHPRVEAMLFPASETAEESNACLQWEGGRSQGID